MQMNTPAPSNALDDNRQGLMGKSVGRVEGRLKVMGKAPYAHEIVEGGMLRPRMALSCRPPVQKAVSSRSAPLLQSAHPACCW